MWGLEAWVNNNKLSHGGSGRGGRGRRSKFEAKRNVSSWTAPLAVWKRKAGDGFMPRMSKRKRWEAGQEKIAWWAECWVGRRA